jgi:hypothetical protein
LSQFPPEVILWANNPPWLERAASDYHGNSKPNRAGRSDPAAAATILRLPYGSTTMKNRTLSVEQAVTLALDFAASFGSAVRRAKRQRRRQAVAGCMLPQINMPLTYWGTTPSMVRQPGDPLTFSFVASSAINESIGWLSVSGTIDVAGKLRAELQRSRALLAAAQAGHHGRAPKSGARYDRRVLRSRAGAAAAPAG